MKNVFDELCSESVTVTSSSIYWLALSTKNELILWLSIRMTKWRSGFCFMKFKIPPALSISGSSTSRYESANSEHKRIEIKIKRKREYDIFKLNIVLIFEILT